MRHCHHIKGAGNIQILWDFREYQKGWFLWFSFFFYYIGISLITILETITGWRHTITFVIKTLKIGENVFRGYFSKAQ